MAAVALYLSKLNVNGQEYEIKDANAVTPSKLEADLASKVGYARYDSEAQSIAFYDIQDERNRTELFKIDATDFIKDGMVSDVAISNGNLVITFNTDAGHNAISIPLTDIFNPANYYDKTSMDAALDLKADASNVYTKSEADGKFLTEHQSLADYPTIETMNTALGQKANVSDIYTQTEIDNKLAAKADKSDTYTKTQVDTALALKQDASTAFSGDYDDLTNKPDLSVYAESADLATVATSGDYDDLSNKPTIPVVPTNVSAFTNDAGYLTEHQSLDNYYTKTQVDTALSEKVSQTEFDTKEEVISTALNELEENKQDKLTAGTGISIQNNVISATGGTQVQSDWNQSDSSAVDYIKNKPTIPTVPTNVSAFTNDAGYLTQHQSLDDYYTKSEIDTTIRGIDDDLDLKADASSVFTKDEANARWPYATRAYVDTDSETLFITSEDRNR